MYKYTDSKGLEVYTFDRLDLYIEEETRMLDRAVIRTTGEPYGPLLTLPPKDFQALKNVLRYTFENSEGVPRAFSFDLWGGSSFFYLAPLVDRPDLFWISCGPLNVYLPTEKMSEVYADIKSAGDLIQSPSTSLYL